MNNFGFISYFTFRPLNKNFFGWKQVQQHKNNWEIYILIVTKTQELLYSSQYKTLISSNFVEFR